MLDLVVLKNNIENNTFKDLLVCICEDSTSEFIVHQYINIFSEKNNFEIKCIDDLNESFIYNIFNVNKSILYFYKTSKLDIDVPKNINLWIICDKIDNINYYNDVAVDIPKLENWQIKDYIMSISKVDEYQADNLIKNYNNIYRLDAEIKKLSIFSSNMYKDIYDQLIYEENKSLFSLVDSLVKKDKLALIDFIKCKSVVEPFSFLSVLIKNIKLVIDIQLAKNPSADTVGISGKQFWAIKNYSCNKYSRDELLYLYKFLIQLDSDIKSGLLNLDDIVLYIISKFLNFM